MTAAHGILRSAKVEKDEYETTAAHRARLPKAAELASQGLREQFGTDRIVLGSDIKSAIYNADAGTLRLSIDSRSPHLHFLISAFESPGSYWKQVDGTLEDTEKTTYESTNAYGAKVTVQKHRARIYSMAFGKTAYKSYHWPPSGAASVKMSPADAKDAKGELRTVLVGKPIAPYISMMMETMRPTFHAPYDISLMYLAVTVDIECAAIVDKRTGKEVFTIPLYVPPAPANTMRSKPQVPSPAKPAVDTAQQAYERRLAAYEEHRRRCERAFPGQPVRISECAGIMPERPRSGERQWRAIPQ